MYTEISLSLPEDIMLKGSREVIVRKIQPISIHGQISLDVYYVAVDEPDEQVRVARLGAESVPKGLDTGQRAFVHFMLGVPTQITLTPDA